MVVYGVIREFYVCVKGGRKTGRRRLTNRQRNRKSMV